MFNKRIIMFVRPMRKAEILLQYNFTAFVTALIQEGQDGEARHDDVDAWGAPSECHGLVRTCNEAAITDLLLEYGYTPASFFAECRDRGLSEKWLWNNIPPIEFDCEGTS